MCYPIKSYENQHCYRLIPSKYPPINLYEDVSDPVQLEAIFAVEAITNPRLAEEVGDFSGIAPEDRLVGTPHCSFVMAAFTHINPDGARFNTSDYGAYYASPDVNTAIKETVYHIERIMSYTSEPAQDIQIRCIDAWFTAKLTDLTGKECLDSQVYHPTNYTHSQAIANNVKSKKGDGILYQSVRHQGYDCYALFKPNLVDKVCQTKHFTYKWNGSSVNSVLEIKLV
ncbi:RES family NAD+ phosphorylase [Photobacterium lipolyticum]|uniref:RES domain-containing protein n=1 Tax=Photobacterium lipolyticum TaxID=266810 RepID=A0A2T3N1R4_9GAMM|nr:RES family NAD+ phosphorylase [Photobacterium lipolyticum]PSW06236.1 RES domain-containing protein [Photobacterium lipolyticum]